MGTWRTRRRTRVRMEFVALDLPTSAMQLTPLGHRVLTIWVVLAGVFSVLSAWAAWRS